jgi:hypothetical protein
LNHAVKLQKHDDRLDALAMAVNYWVDQMAADADVKIRDRRDELFDIELEKFVAGIVGLQGIENSGLTWMKV